MGCLQPEVMWSVVSVQISELCSLEGQAMSEDFDVAPLPDEAGYIYWKEPEWRKSHSPKSFKIKSYFYLSIIHTHKHTGHKGKAWCILTNWTLVSSVPRSRIIRSSPTRWALPPYPPSWLLALLVLELYINGLILLCLVSFTIMFVCGAVISSFSLLYCIPLSEHTTNYLFIL